MARRQTPKAVAEPVDIPARYRKGRFTASDPAVFDAGMPTPPPAPEFLKQTTEYGDDDVGLTWWQIAAIVASILLVIAAVILASAN